MNGLTRPTLAAVAVVAVVVGGLYLLRPGPSAGSRRRPGVTGAIGLAHAIGVTCAVGVTDAFASAEP